MKKMLMTLTAITIACVTHAQAADVTWQKDIKPLFDSNCLSCHGKENPEHDEFAKDKKGYTEKNIGMRMDTYSHLITYVGWPYTGALIRRLDDGTSREDKKPGNMYEYLGATDAERKANLATFKAWVGNWSVKRWKDITKEELDAIQAKY
jgi:mono/diheme cytochrome c family protein